MIVWTENENCDIALSFLEKSACDELWMKICEVRRDLCAVGTGKLVKSFRLAKYTMRKYEQLISI